LYILKINKISKNYCLINYIVNKILFYFLIKLKVKSFKIAINKNLINLIDLFVKKVFLAFIVDKTIFILKTTAYLIY